VKQPGVAETRLHRLPCPQGVLALGQQTLSLLTDKTIEILAQHREEQLRSGIIDAADRSWHFTLYFDATGTELLTCSGVAREPPSRENGQKLQL
jgi:hypothetical protein